MIEHLILILKAVIIGVVEGVTEFLPISSTGHMIIVGRFINFSGDFAKLFEIVIQLGAILAIVYLFKNKIFSSLKSLKIGEEGFKLWTKLLLAFIPAGVIGLLFHEFIEEHLMNPITVSFALILGGIWMIFAEKKYRNNEQTLDIDSIGYKKAFVIGCFQCLSILLPGFSRSAATIIGGWMMGLSSFAAAEFSFFLAIPTMLIATIFSLIKDGAKLTGFEILTLGIGFSVSFIVALIVVEKFMNFLKTKPMKGFAIYRIIIGVLVLLLGVMKVI